MLKWRLFMHREFIALLERRSLESVKWTQDAWTNGSLTYLNHVNKNTEWKIINSILSDFKVSKFNFFDSPNETRHFSRVNFIYCIVCNKLFIAHYLLHSLEGNIYLTLDLLYSFILQTSGLRAIKPLVCTVKLCNKWSVQ